MTLTVVNSSVGIRTIYSSDMLVVGQDGIVATETINGVQILGNSARITNTGMIASGANSAIYGAAGDHYTRIYNQGLISGRSGTIYLNASANNLLGAYIVNGGEIQSVGTGI